MSVRHQSHYKVKTKQIEIHAFLIIRAFYQPEQNRVSIQIERNYVTINGIHTVLRLIFALPKEIVLKWEYKS